MKTLSISSVGFESARGLSSAAFKHGHSFKATASCDANQSAALQNAMQAACAPWQMNDLNQFFPEPSDTAIAEFLAAELTRELATPVAVELQSAPHVTVRCDAENLTHSFSAQFSAAHFLPNVPDGHQCGRLHGHGFKVKLLADARRCTAAELAAAWQPMHARLNHQYLNHIEGLDNPTSENMTQWLWAQLRETLPLVAVEVFETSTAGSRRNETGYTIWKEMRFESAQPYGENGAYTGHSYLARLYLHGDSPDATAGWLRDFAEVKAIFKPIYNQLDHFALDTIADLNAFDCVSLAGWIAQKLSIGLPELVRVDVFENEQVGAAALLNPTQGM